MVLALDRSVVVLQFLPRLDTYGLIRETKAKSGILWKTFEKPKIFPSNFCNSNIIFLFNGGGVSFYFFSLQGGGMATSIYFSPFFDGLLYGKFEKIQAFQSKRNKIK